MSAFGQKKTSFFVTPDRNIILEQQHQRFNYRQTACCLSRRVLLSDVTVIWASRVSCQCRHEPTLNAEAGGGTVSRSMIWKHNR